MLHTKHQPTQSEPQPLAGLAPITQDAKTMNTLNPTQKYNYRFTSATSPLCQAVYAAHSGEYICRIFSQPGGWTAEGAAERGPRRKSRDACVDAYLDRRACDISRQAGAVMKRWRNAG